ncbi:receptor kinase-like protein Xa21 [Canna indica]|uniref:Receptor kinase-like protein Xa21 n=1 Tax=Canna indica TaxID=4628 RepID=A0AAQ3KHE8_9LILI|nr:receptor kinase-like protein Xa21 [Canna indica]
MYDKLRNDYESVKRSTIKPTNFFPRAEPNLFSISSMATMMDARDTIGQGNVEINTSNLTGPAHNGVSKFKTQAKKAKYGFSLWNPGKKSARSNSWKLICSAFDALRTGFKKLIGNDLHTSIVLGSWIFDVPLFWKPSFVNIVFKKINIKHLSTTMRRYTIFSCPTCSSLIPVLLLLSSSSLSLAASVPSDRQALLSFKSLISDDPFGALASWSNGSSLHFCRWRGVKCSNQSHEQRVTALDLDSLELAGKISPFISNLTFLRRLHLPNNRLQGPIPDELGLLSNLQHLNLSDNSLVGMIPTSFFHNCSHLQNLSLFHNSFHGTIPRNLSRCSQLNLIDFSENVLAGEIASDIGSLSKLKFLFLFSNNLTGIISPAIGNLASLIVLDLSHNQLTGDIPHNLSHCSELTYLYLGYNTLEGEIPNGFGALSKLKVLSLRGNRLTGRIPPEIWNLTALETILLGQNKLTGTLPSQVGNLVNLQVLYLSSNNLSGTILPEIGSLARLQILGLGENQLTGIIPSEIGNLVNLNGLDLQFNRLTGLVPASIGNLSSLTYLGLTQNNLTGFIPSSFWNMSSIRIFQIGINHFTGSLPLDIGLTLPYLTNLAIYENHFFGSIPRSLINASNIVHIQLPRNSFTGTIPRGFGSLQSLYHFDLSYNQLEARNPVEWGFLEDLANCSNLAWLQLTSNKLSGSLPQKVPNFSKTFEWFEFNDNYISGTIPEWISNLSSLIFFDMHSNLLTANIPATLANLPRLQKIDLSDNYLTGEIPTTLGKLTQLLELRLNSNKLRGVIPASLANSSLVLLDLALNDLNGTVPKEILTIPTLTMLLNISHNSLQGSLPSEVGNLKNLGQFDLSANRLSGIIPSSLGQCQQLEKLDMARNYFQGSIPSSFTLLKGLQSLDLSRNNLSGRIPEFFGNFQFLSYLNLSFNNLEGEVPRDGIFQNSKKKRNATDYIRNPHIKVSYAELLRATNDFSTTNLIGLGSFGSVYKGILNNPENTIVAVKVLNLQQKGALRSFIAECDALRNIRHRNLVKILTACASIDFRGNDFKALVYEFMPNGSLEKWLHPEANDEGNTQRLSFIQRLNILTDIASALDYLHHHGAEPIVHCDIKPSNVLLDEKMVAHVSDFGLARFLHRLPIDARQKSSTSMILKGSIGYVAPEYGAANKVSAEGDVYSYGILVLEMLTGKRPTSENFKDGLSLVQYVEMALPERVIDIIDPTLQLEEQHAHRQDTQNILENAVEFVTCSLRIGIKCTKESPQDRMLIGDVISELAAMRKAYMELMIEVGAQTEQNARRDKDPIVDKIF